MNIDKEVMESVKKGRIDYLEKQIADMKVNVAIYKRMIDVYGKEEDRKSLEQEEAKMLRFIQAIEAVKEVE